MKIPRPTKYKKESAEDFLRQLPELFKKHGVAENGCIFWKGYKNPIKVSRQGRNFSLVRAIAKVFVDPHIPLVATVSSDEAYVLHKCDVRACVNPEHLFIGTQKDNVDDMMRKNRRKGPVKWSHNK